MDEFRATLAHSLGTALLFTIPSSVGLAILGESMIAVVYQGGRFHASDTHQTAAALACYSVGLAGYSLTKILAPAFYALDDARTPMLVSVASIAVNLGASFAPGEWGRDGTRRAGALDRAGGALRRGGACSSCCGGGIGGLDTPRIASSAWRIAAASAAMGAALLGRAALRAGCGTRRIWRSAFRWESAVFYAAARLLRVPELEAVRTACYTSFSNAPRPEVGRSACKKSIIVWRS